MQHSFLTRAAVWAAAGVILVGGAMSGCSPASAPAAPEQVQPEETSQASAVLRDGKLRLFYSANGNSVLYGDQIVYQGNSTDEIALLEDAESGEISHFLVSVSLVSQKKRSTTLYDKTGAVVQAFDGHRSAQVCGSRVMVSDAIGWEDEFVGEPRHFQVIDLESGSVLTCPDNTVGCMLLPGKQSLLTLYEQDETNSAFDYDRYYNNYYRTVVLLDENGQTIRQFKHASSGVFYDTFGTDCSGWIKLHRQRSADYEDSTTSLYHIPTGTWINDFSYFCAEGYICTGTREEGYRVRTLDSSAPTAVFRYACERYYPISGMGLVWSYGPEYYGYSACWPDGYSVPIRRFYPDAKNSLAVSYEEDGTVLVYDLKTTAHLPRCTLRLADVLQDAVPYDMYIRTFDDGSFLLTCLDENYERFANLYYSDYGQTLKVFDSAYQDISFLTQKDGKMFFSAQHRGPGGAYLYDVLDAEGNVLLRDLGAAFFRNELPEGVFEARRGFTSGWMELDGEWVLQRSIFDSLSGEDRSVWF